MKHIPSVVIAWLLAGAVAACLASHNLYGQTLAGQPVANRPSHMDVLRYAAMRGLTYNEALALHRLRQSSTVPRQMHPRLYGGGTTQPYRSSAPPQFGVGAFPSTGNRVPGSKPFADVRPAPTAFDRYWPLMMEARRDPKTGQVIWYMP